jgi:hypothetical protein
VEHHHRADHPALAVADGRGGLLDGHLVSGARHQHRMLRRGVAAALAEHAQQRIVDRLARDLIDQRQHLPDRLAARLIEPPRGQVLGRRIDVIDPPVRIGADHRIADRLQRDLRALLLGEHLLLGALALGDVGDGALVADDPPGGIAHRAAVLQHHHGRPVAPAQHELGVADLPLALDLLGEAGPVLAIPVERRHVAQRVELLGTVVAEDADEGGIDRLQTPLGPALIHTLDDGLEQAAKLRLARAQRLLGHAPLDRNAGDLRRMRHDAQLPLSRQSRRGMIDPEAAEHPAVGGLDGRRPGGVQPRGQDRRSRPLPERILDHIRHQHLPAQTHRRGARAVLNVDGTVLEGRAQRLGELRRDEQAEAAAVLGEHADRARRADADRLDEVRDRGERLAQRHIGRELLEDLALGAGHALGELRLARPVGEFGGLVGHQPHRLHDAAPLGVHRLELLADQPQQNLKVRHLPARAQRRLLDQGAHMGVQRGTLAQTGLGTHDGRGGRREARDGLGER